MKKISIILAAVVLSTSLLVACKSEKKDKKSEQHHQKDGDHPPHGKEGKPPHAEGDKKGPPKGGHNPEQTKTLEEIGGYNFGDVATDFELMNVDGSTFSLANIENAKGYIVVFTCNECPFSKLYEDRLIALHSEYTPKGYSVVAINPNYSEGDEKEGFEAMQARAEEKAFPFVYLADEGQKIFPQYGAVRTPHVFLLDSERKVQYIGTIDDNAKSPENVEVNYLEDAINALEKGETPNPNFTKAIGCPVKVKKG